ncbi:MAG: hypothetical protein AAF705_19280, partial [Bacteroidota bacterium]
MSRLITLVSFWLLSLTYSGNLDGQIDEKLPVLTPSYTEDFSSYKSFPSMCFGRVLRGGNGRLFFTSCGSSILSNLHLFEFDGYEFRAVKGALRALGDPSSFQGSIDGQIFLGQIYDLDTALGVFAYDISTDELTQFSPPAG